jgi:hypothetical protein
VLTESICRICGYNIFPDCFWKMNHPTHDICPSCGNESGVDDYDLKNVRLFREKCSALNYKWWDSDISPSSGRDPLEQMKNIPPEWL